MEEIYKDYKIKIEQDEDARSPREDDNMLTIICFHRNYALGDDHNYKIDDFRSATEEEAFEKMEKQFREDYDIIEGTIHRIRMYEHGSIGLAIRPSKIATYPYNCQWDSMWVGMLFATYEGVKTTHGWDKEKINNLTDEEKDMLYQGVLAEFDQYNSYVQGEVYGYRIFELDDEGEELDEVDSCWGYIGDSDYCMTEAKSVVDSYYVSVEHFEKGTTTYKFADFEKFAREIYIENEQKDPPEKIPYGFWKNYITNYCDNLKIVGE